MAFLGEQYFKMSNAIFVYDITPIQLSVHFYLCRCAGQRGSCWPRRRKLLIPRPAVSGRARSFRCSSSPNRSKRFDLERTF